MYRLQAPYTYKTSCHDCKTRRRYLRIHFASKEHPSGRWKDAYVVPDTVSLIETARTVGLKSRFDHGLIICSGIKAIHRQRPIQCGWKRIQCAKEPALLATVAEQVIPAPITTPPGTFVQPELQVIGPVDDRWL